MNNKIEREQNTTDIIDAFKEHLPKRIKIKNKHQEITDIFNQMYQTDIPAIKKIYLLVFKNINPDKKFACDIDAFTDDYYYNQDEEETGLHKRKLFINRDGFSLSNAFDINEDKEVDISRTNYIHTLNEKSFIKVLKRLFKHRNEIIGSIEKEYKKSIAIRFFNAFEESGCDKTLNYSDDFDFLEKELSPKIIYHYNQDEIQPININYFSYKNAGNSVEIEIKDTYNRIAFDDLEKISQIFVELMEFLNQYLEHLTIQDTSLLKFIVLLMDAFARELIVDSLEDTKK